MDYAVVLYFDHGSEQRIQQMMKRLCEAGVNRYMLDLDIKPHITLAAWMDEGENNIAEEIKKFAQNIKGIKVHFSSIGIFPASPKVVFLSPVKERKLVDIHSRFYQELEGRIKSFIPYYTPENWVPHCTLATKLSEKEVLLAVDALMDVAFPIETFIDQVGLIRCNPVKDILCCEVEYKESIERKD